MYQYTLRYINDKGHDTIILEDFAESIEDCAREAEKYRGLAADCVRVVIDVAIPMCRREHET